MYFKEKKRKTSLNTEDNKHRAEQTKEVPEGAKASQEESGGNTETFIS